MRNVPVWIDTAPIQKFPKLQKNISVDILVVGAGVTGITTAYLLKKAGSTVALIERERVASIDTGHTTASLHYVTDVGVQQLAKKFRVDRLSKKEASALKKEGDLAAKLGFDAAYLDSAPYFNLPAVRFANQAKFHPRKYLRSLVAKIPGNGSSVFEKSPAIDFDAERRRVKVN